MSSDNSEQVDQLSEHTIVISSGGELDYNEEHDDMPLHVKRDLDIPTLHVEAREGSQEDDINHYSF